MACGTALAQPRLALQNTPLTGGASTVVAQPPGESRRLYQAVRTGVIRVVRDGVLLTTPVLTIPNVQSSFESGLLGFVFHPQFQQNGYFYVLYTTTTAPAGTRV